MELIDALMSNDLVDFLLTNGTFFSQLTLQDKLKIKEKKPTPNLEMNKQEGNGKFIRRFQKVWYENYKWLTGSEKRNKLFCFCCLLFTSSEREFSKIGIGAESLKNMTAKLKKHEISASHISYSIKFSQIGKVRIDHVLSESARLSAIKHNEKVDQHRLILKRLVSTTCFLARQELAFRGQDESEKSLNKGNYLEILDFLAEEEMHLRNHSFVFKDTSLNIQNDLIKCVTKVINEKILTEINSAHYVSIQTDETTDISAESKFSIIFRYANILNGEIEERFVGFHDAKTAEGLATVMQGVLQTWKIDPNKLICQTYDGATANMAGAYGGVNAIIKETYPHALFVPSYGHQTNLVLINACKSIKDVKLFVASLNAFDTFFNDSSKRSKLLRDKGFKLPQPGETKWNGSTIIAHYSELKAAFQSIVDDSGWDSTSINLAVGLKTNLGDLKFLFLLHLWNYIFEYTSDFFDILQTESFDINRCNTELRKCLNSIELLRADETIKKCVNEASIKVLCIKEENIEESGDEMTSSNLEYNDKLIKRLIILTYEILDTIIVNMEYRHKDMEKLDFLELLNDKKFESFNAPHNFPYQSLQKLIAVYPFFDKPKLKGELMYIYGSADKYLPPKELFKFIITNDLKDDLFETTKLLSLILSIPQTSPSCEDSVSTLRRIKTFLRNTMSNEGLSNLSTLAIEKGLIKDLSRRQDFFTRVIDLFAEERDRGIELIYKKV